ncbi:MAG: aminoacyl-histidine dipeptidase [Prevotellaceae bacterium]|jgi:dipeptidase D|nr:aminoacyl-histidine dipeptidase [Prevotellaceae bacterium]
MDTQKIQELEPRALWNNFYNITRVPRPSGKMDEISKFLIDFGKNLGLETLRDDTGNVLIRKPATKGMENRKGVVLQAHMDMVPQKNSDVQHDFERDPIDAYIDGKWVKAHGTTLGADNGIGVAAAMAVLQSTDIEHPTVEMFITVDEETGMDGAFGLKGGLLQGDILLNLDSEEEGELCVGCAGGLDATMTFEYDEEEIEAGDAALQIDLSGLKGGHSGIDIILQRANANKLMFRLLKEAVTDYGARLAQYDGGNMRNAIPREACAIVTVPTENIDSFIDFVNRKRQQFAEEYKGVDDGLTLSVKKVDLTAGLLPEQVQDDLINAVIACPDGVFRMITEAPDVVETSSNLAIIKTDGNSVTINALLRSSVESRKRELAEMFSSLFSIAGARVEFSGAYPGWNPNMQSPILKTMCDTYEKINGSQPKVVIIHAGLECGILGTNYPEMDMISFGPTICHPHSPDEKVSIDTVLLFWEYLKQTLANIPLK